MRWQMSTLLSRWSMQLCVIRKLPANSFRVQSDWLPLFVCFVQFRTRKRLRCMVGMGPVGNVRVWELSDYRQDMRQLLFDFGWRSYFSLVSRFHEQDDWMVFCLIAIVLRYCCVMFAYDLWWIHIGSTTKAWVWILLMPTLLTLSHHLFMSFRKLRRPQNNECVLTDIHSMRPPASFKRN